jgi:secondary thiamine-phosphate synthase enzyme
VKQYFAEIRIETDGRGFFDITKHVENALTHAKFQDGLCTLQIRHTSASLLIQENADPDVRRDLEAFMNRLVPDGDRLFIHTAEGPDDMPAHVRSALTCVNLSIPFQHARLGLGTWQGIYLWEHRRHPHRRAINLHLIGE